MVVLVAWIVALVVAGLVLGIIGFQLVGQAARLDRALAAFRRDVHPRLRDLVAQLPEQTSGGRHSSERIHSRR